MISAREPVANHSGHFEPASHLFFTRQDLSSILTILALGVVFMLPALVIGFPRGDDALVHFRWGSCVEEEMANGTTLPRWLSSSNFGQGSPTMLYYPPVSSFVTAILSISGLQTSTAMTAGALLALWISGLGMFLFGKQLLPRSASLIAAGLYMGMPYHLLDLYHRSALSEFWSFAWVPLILCGITAVGRGGNSSAVCLVAAGYALLLLTNVPVAFMASLVIPIYALCVTHDWRRLLRIVLGLALGTGLAAFFVIPLLAEKDYVAIRHTLGIDYQYFFLLRHLPVAFGYPLFTAENSHHNFLMRCDLIAFGLLVLLIPSLLLIWFGRTGGQKLWAKGPHLAVAVFTTLTLLMTTRPSNLLWKFIPGLPNVQFPPRWLVLTCAGASLLVAIYFATMARRPRAWKAGIAVMAAAIIVNVAMSALLVSRASYNQKGFRKAGVFEDVPEYRPVWWDSLRHEEFTDTPARVQSGEAEIRVIDHRGVYQLYEVNARTASVLTFRTLYFPGWVARIDGAPATVAPGERGNIQLDLGPGIHDLEIRFTDTRPRTVGKIISGISLLACLLFLFAGRRQTYRPQRGESV